MIKAAWFAEVKSTKQKEDTQEEAGFLDLLSLRQKYWMLIFFWLYLLFVVYVITR